MLSRLTQLYEAMTGHDWVQIVILAAVIYAVLRFVGRTCGSGSSIGRGVGLVVVGLFLVAQVVVANLNMTELGFVLDYLLLTFLIGMLIIFQPELRRGLMMLGQSRLWQFLPRQDRSLVDCLVHAADTMSRDRIGALIVIERVDDLAHLCANGEIIESNISASLLRTIFTPRSPLHDGAVIVRKGRIAAAGCQLPMQIRDQLRRDSFGHHLGMRHRAALCASEETDAVLLVVSEETGRISLAQGGQLEPIPPEALKLRLTLVLSSQVLPVLRKAA